MKTVTERDEQMSVAWKREPSVRSTRYEHRPNTYSDPPMVPLPTVLGWVVSLVIVFVGAAIYALLLLG